MKRSSWSFLTRSSWAVLVFLAACNFPGLRVPASQLSVEMLRQTLSAQETAGLESPGSSGLTGTATYQPLPGDPSSWTETTPALEATPAAIHVPDDDAQSFYYLTQPGDTLLALSKRFGAPVTAITPQFDIPEDNFLPQGVLLLIPRQVEGPLYPGALLPDSEVVQSPTTLDLDVRAFVHQAQGI